MSATFAHPWVLALLVLPTLLLAWVWRRTGSASGASGRLALPYDHAGVAHARGWRVLLDGAASLPVLLLAVAIVLLAGPRRASEPKTKRSLTNIEFCLDVSGSMMAEFGQGTRYDAAMKSINDFLDVRAGDAFGLTVFGNQVLHWVPLTSDVSAFRCAPPFLQPDGLPRWFNGTEIGKALLACLKVLAAREEGDRMVILVSDGYSYDLSNGKDAEIGRRLRDHGIVVYAIHVADGSPPGELVTVTRTTGGDVFAAGDPQALEAVFRRIDAMVPARLEKTRPESLDDFEPASALGLGLLGLFLASSFGLRYAPW